MSTLKKKFQEQLEGENSQPLVDPSSWPSHLNIKQKDLKLVENYLILVRKHNTPKEYFRNDLLVIFLSL
jgi:hypothetical protein